MPWLARADWTRPSGPARNTSADACATAKCRSRRLFDRGSNAGARLSIAPLKGGRLAIEFYQEGLLRPLSAAELSDGTVRYLLLVAALLTPRPPSLMVLNEPETSLHPDLLLALARLIIRASEQCQVWVVSHARRLISALQEDEECNCIVLEKTLGQTGVVGQRVLDEPAWYWPD